MAWLVGDGFDFYSVADDATLATEIWSLETFCTLGAAGTSRFGAGQYMALGNFSATAGNMRTVTFANSTTIFVNLNIRTIQAHVNGGTTQLGGFSWNDGATRQGGLYLRDGGDFVVTDGALGGTVLATSSVLCPNANVWHHIQVKIVVNNSTGTVELRLDGATSADFSSGSINTRNGTGNSYANCIHFTANSAGQESIDDFYVFNDQGAAPNTWQGDIRAVQQMPNSDDTAVWTPNSGPSNYSRVSELHQDGNTSYVSSNTPGDIDIYEITPLASTPVSIVAVVAKYMARMDDAGPHTVNLQFTSGGTTVNSSDYVCTGSYAYRQTVYAANPDTSSSWTEATVNAILLGPKVVV